MTPARESEEALLQLQKQAEAHKAGVSKASRENSPRGGGAEATAKFARSKVPPAKVSGGTAPASPTGAIL